MIRLAIAVLCLWWLYTAWAYWSSDDPRTPRFADVVTIVAILVLALIGFLVW